MADNDVPGMADAIEHRRKALGLSPTDLRRASNLTLEGWKPVRAGERRGYQDKTRVGVARALRWPENWYDRLLAGDDPAAFPDVAWPVALTLEDRMAAVEAKLEALTQLVMRSDS